MRGLLEPEVLELLDTDGRSPDGALDSLLSGRTGVEAAAMPLGRRDAALAELRLRTFGALVEVRADCAACGDQLEAELDLRDLPLDIDVPDRVSLEVGGETVTVAMPTVRDLRAAAASSDPRRTIVERSVGAAVTEEQLDAIEAALEEADPMLDVALALTCPSCAAVSPTRFDIAGHLWSEIETYAHRLTLEVHWLASRYGWTEPEVLALSPGRRRAYLELGAS